MQIAFTDEVCAINQAIAEKTGQEKFSVWFKNTTRLALGPDCLTISVPNNFIGNWIESHFLPDISHALLRVTGSKKKVVFAIDTALAGPKPDNKGAGLRIQKSPDQSPQAARPDRPAGVPLSRPLRLILDDFVVGPKNQLAFNAAQAVVREEKSPFNPLFFHGGYGVGKTHLLQGICNALGQARPGARWLYVSAEDFANQYVLAIKTRKLEVFRTRFRQTDLLAIDDIHFLASKTVMQEEFLHTFNSIDLAGKQVVLASDAHPKMISQLCERLVNRFVSGMVVKIEPPDFETRCIICRRKAQLMKVEIPESAIEYIADKVASNVRELEGALLKIIAFASISGEKITVSLSQNVLAEHIARTDPIVHASDITGAVTSYFGVSSSDVHSSKKDRTVSLTRAFCMYLTRRFTRMSYPEIGKLMGGKNHATVILACRKIEGLLDRNAQIHWQAANGNRNAKARDVMDKLVENISG